MTHYEINLERDQTSIRLQPGDTVDVWLSENPTTGYGWVIDATPEATSGVSVVSSVFHPSSEGGIGRGGRRQVTVRADAVGQVRLTVASRRPWEAPDIPATTRYLDLDIFPS